MCFPYFYFLQIYYCANKASCYYRYELILSHAIVHNVCSFIEYFIVYTNNLLLVFTREFIRVKFENGANKMFICFFCYEFYFN